MAQAFTFRAFGAERLILFRRTYEDRSNDQVDICNEITSLHTSSRLFSKKSGVLSINESTPGVMKRRRFDLEFETSGELNLALTENGISRFIRHPKE